MIIKQNGRISHFSVYFPILKCHSSSPLPPSPLVFSPSSYLHLSLSPSLPITPRLPLSSLSPRLPLSFPPISPPLQLPLKKSDFSHFFEKGRKKKKRFSVALPSRMNKKKVIIFSLHFPRHVS